MKKKQRMKLLKKTLFIEEKFSFKEECEFPMPSPEMYAIWKDYMRREELEEKSVMDYNKDSIIFSSTNPNINRSLQETCFSNGIHWRGGDNKPTNLREWLIVYTNCMAYWPSESGDSVEEVAKNDNHLLITDNHLHHLREWLRVKGLLREEEEEMDYSKTTMCLAHMTEEVNRFMQETCIRGGFRWSSDAGCEIHCTNKSLILHKENKRFGWVEHGRAESWAKERDNEYLYIGNNHSYHLTNWLKYHKLNSTKETPPKQSTPPSNMTGADLLIKEITERILADINPRLMSSDNVKSLVLKELETKKLTTIVIEDKRKSPPEVKELTEPTHLMLPDVLGVLKSSCWCAIVGPTGGGKTLGVMQAAKVLDISLVCIKQMTRIIAPHDLIGYMDANGCYRKGAWTDAIIGWEFKNTDHNIPDKVVECPAIIVVDEMDNANENVIMIIKALQTGKIAMPYGMQSVNPKLMVVATMNTWGNGANREYVGRCAQDAALLNEFNFVEWNYDEEFEWELLKREFASYESTGDYKLEDIQRLLDMFKKMRMKVEQQKVRCIISTRNIINTLKLLVNNGEWSIHKTLLMTVYRGLKEEEIKRVECPEVWRAPKKALKKPDRDMPPTQLEVATQRSISQFPSLSPAKINPDGSIEVECPI